MYGWLVHEILPKVGLSLPEPTVHVYGVSSSSRVYIYEVIVDGAPARVVGKFFGSDPDASDELKRLRLRLEVDNIRRLRGIGLDRGAHRVIRLLGHNEYINYVLAEEYGSGLPLERLIKGAVFQGEEAGLYWGLSELAYFLFRLHSRSRDGSSVDFGREASYFRETLSRVAGQVSDRMAQEFQRLLERWVGRPFMWSPRSVIVHGDCSPTNFLLSSDPRLLAVDLERSRRSDPAFDTGRVAGELKHHFMMWTGDGWRAEPFIGHFYSQYSSH
ncbi:MAG: phosphotransferase, partial [Candidatus Bathyarchaeia archaeon]